MTCMRRRDPPPQETRGIKAVSGLVQHLILLLIGQLPHKRANVPLQLVDRDGLCGPKHLQSP